MVRFYSPYRVDRNLGKAYNDEFRLVNDEDYICLTDWDVMPLLHDTRKHIIEYTEKFPNVDVFTCYANRSHVNSTQQLLNGKVSEETDITYHMERAREQAKYLYEVKEVTGNISGFLMVVSKRLWNEIPFFEDGRCLGVDTNFSIKLRQKRKKIFCMRGVYVWHSYRLMTHVKDVSHLV